MAVFHCYRGDVSNIAIDKPNSFALTDDDGRSWICREEPGDSIQYNEQEAIELEMAAAAVLKNGFWNEGSTRHSLVCERHELPAKLAESKPPLESSS